MKIESDDFELFGLPRRHALDDTALAARWRELQADVHPDRFVAEAAAEQRVAMQWALRVDTAYRRLKDPLQRAAYLCELSGTPVDAENNTSMPIDFLVRQMEWREALDGADALPAVASLARDVARHRAAALASLASALDTDRDFPAAAQQVRALMFVERFAADVDRRLEALEQ